MYALCATVSRKSVLNNNPFNKTCITRFFWMFFSLKTRHKMENCDKSTGSVPYRSLRSSFLDVHCLLLVVRTREEREIQRKNAKIIELSESLYFKAYFIVMLPICMHLKNFNLTLTQPKDHLLRINGFMPASFQNFFLSLNKRKHFEPHR